MLFVALGPAMLLLVGLLSDDHQSARLLGTVQALEVVVPESLASSDLIGGSGILRQTAGKVLDEREAASQRTVHPET